MPWNSISPDGTKSVKDNELPMQQNTTYTEATMGNSTNTSKDHFWNIGANEDGHHRAVQMKAYEDTYVGAPTEPTLATDMAGAIYLKEVNARVQGFYTNVVNEYQFIPSFLSGTVVFPGSGAANAVKIADIPNNAYGQIFLFSTTSPSLLALSYTVGFFYTTGGVIYAYNQAGVSLGSILFADTGNLELQGFVRIGSGLGTPITFEYRIKFWGT